MKIYYDYDDRDVKWSPYYNFEEWIRDVMRAHLKNDEKNVKQRSKKRKKRKVKVKPVNFGIGQRKIELNANVPTI